MNVLVPPFKIVNDPLIGQLLLNDKYVLEKVNDPFLNIKMIELSNHRFLILQIPLVLINQGISFINYIPDVVEYCCIGAHVQLREFVSQILILFLLLLQFAMHVLNLNVVSFQLANNEFLILTSDKE